MEKLKSSKKLIVSIVAVVVIVCGIFLAKNAFSPKYDGTMKVEIVDMSGKTINEKDIQFNEGDKLVTLLDENFDNVKVENGMLYTIDQLTTPEDWSSFICIYVNDEMSEVGIEEIQFEDGTVLSFRDTENNYEQ